MPATATDPTIEVIPEDECLRLLAGHEIGRFAVAAPEAHPHVVPVTYRLDGAAVMFRTGSGTKLTLLRGSPVTFEVDDIDRTTRSGWSVVVAGAAFEMPCLEVDHLGIEPWAPGRHDHWIRIVPASVTGRRIRLGELSWPLDLRGYA